MALWNVGHGTFPMRANTAEERAAENRLLYVALTRAKRSLGLVSMGLDNLNGLNLVSYIPRGSLTQLLTADMDIEALEDFLGS